MLSIGETVLILRQKAKMSELFYVIINEVGNLQYEMYGLHYEHIRLNKKVNAT